MNKLLLKIQKKMRYSKIVRTMAKPYIDIKRNCELKKFYKTKDAEYIRKFRNKYMGKRCFIIGNGPSLNPEDLTLIKNELSFACNRIYNIFDKTEWRPSFYMCIDPQTLKEEIGNIKNAECGIKFLDNRAKKYGQCVKDELHYIFIFSLFEPKKERQIMSTISEDVSKYFSAAQTVTANEIEFAIYMGFKEIILLGVDHNYPISIDKDGKKNIDNSVKSHFDGGGSKEQSLHYIYYDAATECYENIEKYTKCHGIKIYNASRNTKLEAFTKKRLEEILYENNI